MPNRPVKSQSKSYEVGYRRPPKQSQFKPGQSGNPSGTRHKTSSIAEDLRPLLIDALYQCVHAVAAGDRHALRDVDLLTEMLGIDLRAGEGKRNVTSLTETEWRQALIHRGIPAQLLPPVDEAGSEPPPDPPLPPDVEDESKE